MQEGKGLPEEEECAVTRSQEGQACVGRTRIVDRDPEAGRRAQEECQVGSVYTGRAGYTWVCAG